MKKFTFILLVIFIICIIGCLDPRQAFNTLFDNIRTVTVVEQDERTIIMQPQTVFRYRGWTPHRIAFDKTGYVYGLFQSERGRKWILLQFEPTGKLNKEICRIREIPGTVTSTVKMRAMDLVRDIRGNFIILDVYTSQILKIGATGELVGSFKISDDSTVRAHSIAVDQNNLLYVSISKPKRFGQKRNYYILKFDMEENLIETLRVDLPFRGLAVNTAGEIYAICPVGGYNQSLISQFIQRGKELTDG